MKENDLFNIRTHNNLLSTGSDADGAGYLHDVRESEV